MVSYADLAVLLSGVSRGVSSRLPAGSEVVAVWPSMDGNRPEAMVYVRHDSFDAVPPGTPIPEAGYVRLPLL